ncbi:aminotransferase class I/II-fold pyridoxal phosphate-dependent enzyme [archaeon]|nr:MAG: aminotransferase class I/II-fold pyridoxal phosphate-dependent enzyme [archaeon]
MRVQENARVTAERLAVCPGLQVVVPQGAMYVMFEIKTDKFVDLPSDVEFARLLLAEENVFVLPGQVCAATCVCARACACEGIPASYC